MEQFESALSEVAMHRQLADHGSCDFCNWLVKMAEGERNRELLRHFTSDSTTFTKSDLLLFMYVGLKLGRRQATEEILKTEGLGP